jgi:MFS family permease
MSGWQKVVEFLGLRRNTALLLAALVFAGTGEKLWIGFVPKYLQTLGATVVVIGLFDALQTLLGALYAYPGGWLTDHWGQRRSLMLFSALSLAGYVVVLVWHHWLAVVFGAFLFLAWSAFSLPTTFSVVATSLKQHQHTMGIGVQSLVRRVPMMAGPLLCGWLITRFGWQEGIRLALLCCIGLGAVTMAFQWKMLDEVPSSRFQAPAEVPNYGGARPEKLQTPEKFQTPGTQKEISFVRVVKSFNPTLRELLVSDILIRFCERLPYAFVILWAMNHVGVNAQQFGVLTAIEMITAMLCYIPVAHLADKYGQRPFVFATFVFFTLFPVSLLWADSFGWLALAFAVRGLKEFGEPARKALIIAQAQPELRSRTYGAYYLIRDCVVTSGSFLGAWLWTIGPRANFIGAAILGASGAAWFWWFIQRSRPGAQSSSSAQPFPAVSA